MILLSYLNGFRFSQQLTSFNWFLSFGGFFRNALNQTWQRCSEKGVGESSTNLLFETCFKNLHTFIISVTYFLKLRHHKNVFSFNSWFLDCLTNFGFISGKKKKTKSKWSICTITKLKVIIGFLDYAQSLCFSMVRPRSWRFRRSFCRFSRIRVQVLTRKRTTLLVEHLQFYETHELRPILPSTTCKLVGRTVV